ncbi:hypothetical protein [Kitasatospora sp. HPMI-4]|uniref:hypothetical protein n=1 Tax=Kitasatospora sp. HPMI-4 TaxID=3448443 RepID=UPI003F1978CA
MTRPLRGVDGRRIREFTGNDYGRQLSSGDIAACPARGGELIRLRADGTGTEFVIPEQGCAASTGYLPIPARARHEKNIELLIDFYYQQKIAAELTAGINHVSPVAGTKDEPARLAPDVAENPLIVPPLETATKVHAFRTLSEAEETDSGASSPCRSAPNRSAPDPHIGPCTCSTAPDRETP